MQLFFPKSSNYSNDLNFHPRSPKFTKIYNRTRAATVGTTHLEHCQPRVRQGTTPETTWTSTGAASAHEKTKIHATGGHRRRPERRDDDDGASGRARRLPEHLWLLMLLLQAGWLAEAPKCPPVLSRAHAAAKSRGLYTREARGLRAQKLCARFVIVLCTTDMAFQCYSLYGWCV